MLNPIEPRAIRVINGILEILHRGLKNHFGQRKDNKYNNGNGGKNGYPKKWINLPLCCHGFLIPYLNPF